MSEIQEKNYSELKSFVDRNSFVFAEKSEGQCKRIDVKSGSSSAVIKVYNTGTIQIQGADSKLKDKLNEIKEIIQSGSVVGESLPFEIERFPELLMERIPGIDPVIVRFVHESIISVKAGSNLGCAFLLGGASEKAVLLLIEAYLSAIKDETLKDKFRSRTSGKFISRAFDEFKASFKSSKNKPKDYGWSNDIEVKIEAIFQFCRICRNETGHPHLPPNLDRGVLIANMGQFVKYIEDMYELIGFYKENNVDL